MCNLGLSSPGGFGSAGFFFPLAFSAVRLLPSPGGVEEAGGVVEHQIHLMRTKTAANGLAGCP